MFPRPLSNLSSALSLPPNSEGSNLTPAHHFSDFRFKTYAPVAFRYFRELFGIRPDDYLVRSSSPGAASIGAFGCMCICLKANNVLTVASSLHTGARTLTHAPTCTRTHSV